MSDIVERLRKNADWLVSCACGNIPDDARDWIEAADLITRLRAENEAAKVSLTTFERENMLLSEALATARAEAFERAAQIAENASFMMPIDWWMQSSKKEVSVESCLQVAAAIRKASGEDKT